jgi:hypothetical protein
LKRAERKSCKKNLEINKKEVPLHPLLKRQRHDKAKTKFLKSTKINAGAAAQSRKRFESLNYHMRRSFERSKVH